MKTIYYCVPGDCPESFYRLELAGETIGLDVWNSIAEKAAADYYRNHDGMTETDWPVEITLHLIEHGEVLHRARVDLGLNPQFSAVEIVDGIRTFDTGGIITYPGFIRNLHDSKP